MADSMEKMIREEQQIVDEVIEQISEEIQSLRSEVRKPRDYIEQRVQAYLAWKLANYEEALASPYFGRMEMQYPDKDSPVSYLIGERSISKSGVDEIVLDWRSPIGGIFYSFNGGDGQETYQLDNGETGTVTVLRKRNVLMENAKVMYVNEIRSEALPDEDDAEFLDGYADEFLARFGSDKSKDYQLRKIIATIQKEQNKAIRLGILEPVLIQGVAGSGKTSIAVHRLSYLLYQYRNRLNPEKILILAPSRLFISYMQNILPGLELERIQQNTFFDLVKGWLPRIKKIQSPQEWLNRAVQSGLQNRRNRALRYKSSMRFYKAIERYLDHLEEHFFQPAELELPAFAGEPVLTKEPFLKIYAGYKHLPLNQRLKETKDSIRNWMELELKKQIQYLENHFISLKKDLWKINISSEEKIHKEAENTLEEIFKHQCKKLKETWSEQIDGFLSQWRPIDPVQLYQNLFNADLLRGLDDRLTPELAAEIAASAPDITHSIGYEDIAPLLLITMRVEPVKDAEFDYMVIDEAQDFSPFQLAILKKFTKSMTILGDQTQNIYGDLGMQDWDELISEVFGHQIHRLDLVISYRSTYEIMNFANHVIQKSGLPLPAIRPINRHGEEPKFRKVTGGAQLSEQMRKLIDQLREKGYNKIAVISKDLKLSKTLYGIFRENGMQEIQLVEDANDALREPVIFIPSTLVKGLEFDAVIISNANKKTFSPDPFDAKLFFVSITRAQEELHVFYYDEPSPLFEDLIHASEPRQSIDLLDDLL